MAVSNRYDPFGYKALTAAIASLEKAVLAAVNSPAWLHPSVAAAESGAAAALNLPIIDVGGQIYAKLDAIKADTVTILSDEVKDMAAIDDLNTAVTALTTEVGVVVTNMNTLMTDLQNALSTNNDAGIETAVSGINAQVAALQAAVTADTPPAS